MLMVLFFQHIILNVLVPIACIACSVASVMGCTNTSQLHDIPMVSKLNSMPFVEIEILNLQFYPSAVKYNRLRTSNRKQCRFGDVVPVPRRGSRYPSPDGYTTATADKEITSSLNYFYAISFVGKLLN